MAPTIPSDQGLAVWNAASGVTDGRPDLTSAAVARFAEIVTPALAAHLLGDDTVEDAVGADALTHSRLINRFNAAAQKAALNRIIAGGIDCVAIKGFAFAHALYPKPEIRTIGDLDLLVRTADRDRLIGLLAGEGWTFRPLPTPPWGFISTASYMPFVSADGGVNLDIHIHPDCYPAYLSLTTETVFAASRRVDADGLAVRIPDDTHAFVLCATNAAKDKFGIHASRKVVDALGLLAGGSVDFAGAMQLARSGGFGGPYRVFLALLHALGGPLPDDCAPATLPLRARGEFARIVAETAALYPAAPGRMATLRRELTACTEPSVGLHNLVRRLTGLVRPASGIPDGMGIA